jgi:T-complex protein 1 subunit epsilon
VVVLAGAILE